MAMINFLLNTQFLDTPPWRSDGDAQRSFLVLDLLNLNFIMLIIIWLVKIEIYILFLFIAEDIDFVRE